MLRFGSRLTILMVLPLWILFLPIAAFTRNYDRLARTLRGRRLTVRVTGDTTVTFDGRFFGNVAEIWFRRVYLALPGFGVRENDTVVDLGANTGVFSTAAAACGCRVISVEAQSGYAPIIEENAKLNRCEERVIVVTGLIGPGTGLFKESATLRGSSHFIDEPKVYSMDEIVQRFAIERIHFLKVDIEGSEFDLFSRNERWISMVESIAMEVHPTLGSAKDLVASLQARGFRTWLLNNELEATDRLTTESGYLYARRAESI